MVRSHYGGYQNHERGPAFIVIENIKACVRAIIQDLPLERQQSFLTSSEIHIPIAGLIELRKSYILSQEQRNPHPYCWTD